MSSNYKLQTDINEALAMAEALEDYVRGTELYGHAGGGFFSPMPSLTVGALLLRLRRLDALRDELNDRQRKKLDKAVDIFTSTRTEWTLHYTEKMLKEAHSRIDSMQAFFKECGESAVNCLQNYRPELLKRTIVQEILAEMETLKESDDDLTVKIKAADNKLHGYLSPDDFQWSELLAAVYPQDVYWWLYQKPPTP